MDGVHSTNPMGEVPDPASRNLPIIVSENTDRISAAARLLLKAVALLALGAAVNLPAYDLLLGRMNPRPWGTYNAAIVAGVIASVAGLLWWASRPVTWKIDAHGITQDGPESRRRDLRWADMRWIRCWSHVLEFKGQDDLPPVRLPRAAIARERRASILAAFDAVLREHFHFPPTLAGGIGRTLARLFTLFGAVYGPPCLYLFGFFRPMAQQPQTILSWGWVRRLIDWNVQAASVLVPLILFSPVLGYLWMATWSSYRRTIRIVQLEPKRPAAPGA